jgi:poly(A) polymerase
VEEILTNLVQKARLPRRIAEGTRLLLLAQRALHGERRRRGSPTRFLRSPHFADALALMEMGVRVTGEGQEALRRWQQREGAARASTPPLRSLPQSRRGRRPDENQARPSSGPEGAAETDAEDEFPFSGPGLL